MIDFILPDIGEGIVECELLKWLVAEGDTITEDQAVAEVMTDKATVEIPAMHNGVVSKLYYQEGDIAKVHSPLFAMQRADQTSAGNEVTADKKNDAETISDVQQNNAQAPSVEAFILPDIGEGIVECEIMQWHIQEGDVVTEDQVVVEVMTDKAVVEIPAKYNGKIIKLHYNKGDIAGVHTPLFDQEVLTLSSGRASDANSSSSVKQSASSNVSASKKQQQTSSNTRDQGGIFEPPVEVGRALASPAVRRLAREHGISLDQVRPSGAKGRVLKQDVHAFVNVDTKIENATESLKQDSLNTPASVPAEQQADRVESIKGIRAAMAKQMMASVSTIPHFSVSDELCMDKLIALRTSLKPMFEAENVKLSFLPFFIKAMSLAMSSFPVINSRLNSDGSELTYLQSHNIGIAVDSKIGLLVPNIKNVQSLSLFEIAEHVNGIIERARQGKLSNAELSGGTISISNIGAIGGITATPVINKPEVAIVALGKTQTLPRFNDTGEVFASNIMTINWSGDHRVIDGATMVKFNNLWMDYLCHPEKMLMHLK